jgi:hypothetical protein
MAAEESRRSRRSSTTRREHSRSKRPSDKVDHGRITVSAVDDRGAKSCAADGVDKPDGGASERDRSDGESANGYTQPECETAKREQQAARRPAHGHKPTRETGNRHTSNGDVPDRDDAPRHARSHGGRIKSRANMNEWPVANGGVRPVFESENGSLLGARPAHDTRTVAANALAADRLLADGAETDSW